MTSSFIILAATSVDLLIGDPRWLPHPVRWMGKWIIFLEPRLRRLFPTHLRIGGVLLWCLVVLPAYGLTFFAIYCAHTIHPFLGISVEILCIAFTLAWRSLTDEGRIIRRALQEHRLDDARERLQTIVSRDCSRLDEAGVIRGTLESLTENTSDGIIAPLCFAFLGGAPLAMAYKAVNTLDSMVGYKNSTYYYFGWFSARIDDVVNLLPARITGCLFVLASCFLSGHPYKAMRAWWRDAQKGPSPNGGIPIVTFAGAQNITLGGDCFAKTGERIPIPFVGGERRELHITDLSSALTYVHVVTLAGLLFGVSAVALN